MENNFIVKCLDDFLKSNKPNFSVLIDGKWGVGKTHFIKKYLQEPSNSKEKALYVSFAGCSSTKDLEEKIFKELLSINIDEDSQLTLSSLQFISKFGLNEILDNSDQAVQSLATSVLTSLFKKSKGKAFDLKIKEIETLVFDDLERTNLPIKELLGFINQYVEHSSKKVILIADTTSFKKNKRKSFNKTKEKIIGQEVTFKQNIKNVVNYYYSQINFRQSADLEQCFYNEVITLMNDNNIENINLRVLRRVFSDLEKIENSLRFDNLDCVKLFRDIFKLRLNISVNKIKINHLLVLSNKHKLHIGDETTQKISNIFTDEINLYFEYQGFKFFYYYLKYGSIPEDVNWLKKYYTKSPFPDWYKLYTLQGFTSTEELKGEYSRLWSHVNQELKSISDLLHLIGISLRLSKFGLIRREEVIEFSELAIEKLSPSKIETYFSKYEITNNMYLNFQVQEHKDADFITIRNKLNKKLNCYIKNKLHDQLTVILNDLSLNQLDSFLSLSSKSREIKDWLTDELISTPILDDDFAEEFFEHIKSFDSRDLRTIFWVLKNRVDYFKFKETNEKIFLDKLELLISDLMSGEDVLKKMNFDMSKELFEHLFKANN